MSDSPVFDAFEAPPVDLSLPQALLAARARYGGDRIILEDQDRATLTYDRLILGAMVLGRKLAAGTEEGESIGLLLPNVNGCAVAIFGLLFRNRTPVMLNFSAGLRNLKSACETAQIRTIVTARKFVENAKLDEVVAALGEGRRIIWLDEVRGQISTFDKILA